MNKIIAALALALASTAANAVTYTFDYRITNVMYPSPTSFHVGDAGIGSLTFDFATEAEGLPDASFGTVWLQPNMNLSIQKGGTTFVLIAGGKARIEQTPSDMVTNDWMAFFSTEAFSRTSLAVSGLSNTTSDHNFSRSNFEALLASGYGTYFGFDDTALVNGVVNNLSEVAAPVPEPGEWAMMAAGLAIVGGLGRRRAAHV